MPSVSVEADAIKALVGVRGAFGALLGALPDRPVRPRQIERLLSIDKTLAWRVSKLVHEPDIVLAAQQLPMSAAIETFLTAAAAHGVPALLIERARQAVQDFEAVVRVHAGERALLDMMLASASPAAQRRASRGHRKAAFQANSFIWGVQVRTHISAYFLHPGADKDWVDIAWVRGLFGLRRVRRVPWVIGRMRWINDDGQPQLPYELEPIDPTPPGAGGLPGVPLIPAFCSDPLPAVRRVLIASNFVEDELVEAPAGNQGETTCVTGEVGRRIAPRYRDESNHHANMDSGIRAPAERVQLDVFLHRDLAPPAPPTLLVYSDVGAHPAAYRNPRDLLDVGGEVLALSADPAAVFTSHVPRYGELVAHVCARLGWPQEEFVLYRVTIDYPVLPSSVDMRWELVPKRV